MLALDELLREIGADKSSDFNKTYGGKTTTEILCDQTATEILSKYAERICPDALHHFVEQGHTFPELLVLSEDDLQKRVYEELNVSHLKCALQFAQLIPDAEARSNALKDIVESNVAASNRYALDGDLYEFNKFFKEAESVAMLIPSKRVMNEALGKVADTNIAIADGYRLAKKIDGFCECEFIKDAERVIELMTDPEIQCHYYCKIANSHRLYGVNVYETEKFIRKATEVAQFIGGYGQCLALIRVADLQRSTRDSEGFNKSLDDAERIAIEKHPAATEYLWSYVLYKIADSHRFAGNLVKFNEIIKKAESLAQELYDVVERCQVLKDIAESYKLAGNLNEFNRIVQAMSKIAEKLIAGAARPELARASKAFKDLIQKATSVAGSIPSDYEKSLAFSNIARILGPSKAETSEDDRSKRARHLEMSAIDI